jgi:hypothetical protein
MVMKDNSFNDNKSSQQQQEAHFVVQHHYHDHANENLNELVDNRPCRGGVTTPFPIKLHEMLDRVEEDGNAHIVSWQPHGRCFVVHKPKEFKELLPSYFKLSKMASFQRQLNLYGFSRLTRGRDKGGYYHELFLRGRQSLANKILRIKVKGTGVRARSNPNAEPDLWQMTWVGSSVQSSTVSKSSCSSNSADSVSSSESDNSIVANETLSQSFLNATAPFAPSETFKALPPPPLTLMQPSAQTLKEEEDDLVWSFGGKSFHYLDPFQMCDGEKRLLKNQINILPGKDEMESFISELRLEDICSDINKVDDCDDSAFVDMLERVIS